ncbi:MAG: L-histidine N(alpha)-methyltransferase [Myxococcota bacterium]
MSALANATPDGAVRDAAAALLSTPPSLPPWLFYDARGTELFEQITELPEYYLTRAERSILDAHADEIVALAAAGTSQPLHVVELGAGLATKTQRVLAAVVARQGRCLYLPVDVSTSALEQVVARLAREEPQVTVRPVAGTHTDALPAIRDLGPRRLVLFVGSSIGNYTDAEAVALLAAVAQTLRPGGALLLGTDRRKDPAVLLPAYDDAAGVTAAFDLNVLARLNRELGADFALERWRHEARWNDAQSRIEMHLVSTEDQVVHLPGVGVARFTAGESIHTESSVKYDEAHVDRLLSAAGFTRERTWTDAEGRFDLHLARR